MGNFSIALNLKTKAITQYHNFDFSDLSISNNGPIGSNTVGLHALNTGYTDDNIGISAFAEVFATTFGLPNLKKLRYFTLGMESDTGIKTDIIMDKTSVSEYTQAPRPGYAMVRTTGRRKHTGYSVAFKFMNVSNGFFSINSISVVPIMRNQNIR